MKHWGGRVAVASQVGAIWCPTYGCIRVWNGIAGKREEFTVGEARDICARADRALAARSDDGEAGLFVDDGGALRPLIVSRAWLIALIAAVRRELRKRDAQAARSATACIDGDSDPGSWARHIRHMEGLRPAPTRKDIGAEARTV